ncbi:MAG: ATP-binding protein [Bacteroidales bacterium]|nr:ATP-binding protein [Candidatus Physcocola equi]
MGNKTDIFEGMECENLDFNDKKRDRVKNQIGQVAPTLMANMDAIVKLSEDSGLDSRFFDDAKPYIEFVKDKLGLSANQVILLSLFAELSCSRSDVELDQISSHMDCSNLKLLSMKTDLDELCQKGYLTKCVGRPPFRGDDKCFTLPEKVIKALSDNQPFIPESDYDLSLDTFFSRIHDIFDENNNDDDIMLKIDSLMEKNPKLSFVKSYKKMCKEKAFNPIERYIFFYLCNSAVNEGDFVSTTREMLENVKPFVKARSARSRLDSGECSLLKENIIENVPDNGLYGSAFRLTRDTINSFLNSLCQVEDCSAKNLLKWDSFAEKRMFYNPEEGEQINRVTDLLKEDNFKMVQQRLEKCGLRKGFACLFYGAPGTGKTETVNQLARVTGRDVMVVDVSQIKDKFVGESEKNIKQAFRRYADLVKNSDKAPILLFNEADAVLGKRTEGAERAVDKMENSIQNIILQEMENLEGIMIATTNLTQNLDSAFERRFLYKVEFKNPSVEAKKNIWLSMIPDMNESLAERLATDYDFSGGQIENIVRKSSVNYILTGKEATADDYIKFCDCERINKKDKAQKIGFVR